MMCLYAPQRVSALFCASSSPKLTRRAACLLQFTTVQICGCCRGRHWPREHVDISTDVRMVEGHTKPPQCTMASDTSTHEADCAVHTARCSGHCGQAQSQLRTLWVSGTHDKLLNPRLDTPDLCTAWSGRSAGLLLKVCSGSFLPPEVPRHCPTNIIMSRNLLRYSEICREIVSVGVDMTLFWTATSRCGCWRSTAPPRSNTPPLSPLAS